MLEYFKIINETILIKLNKFIYKNGLTKIIGITADLPIFFAPIFLVAAWIYYTFTTNNIEDKKKLLNIFYSTILSILTNLIIQQFVHFERPETVVKPILEHLPDASFPSDHAAVSFAFLTSLYLFGYKKTFWIYLPFVVLMNISRIAGGIHWFWDVIVGMFIGIFWAFMVKKLRKTLFFEKLSNFILKIAKFFKL